MDDLQKGAPPAVVVDGKAIAPQSARQQIQNILLGQAWKQHGVGMKKQAIATGWRACVANPVCISAWKSLAALVLR